MAAGQVVHGAHAVGATLAEIAFQGLCDSALRQAEARAAAGDVHAARSLARALRRAQEAAAQYRARALRAEAVVVKLVGRRAG